jgi:hypothetical protein
MPEPSKEELLARIAELEKQAGPRRKGTLEFRVGEKGGVSVYGLAVFPSRCITNSGFASSALPRTFAPFSRRISPSSN